MPMLYLTSTIHCQFLVIYWRLKTVRERCLRLQPPLNQLIVHASA